MDANDDGSFGRLISNWRRQWGARELIVILVVVTIVGGIWFFVELAQETTAGETPWVDETLLLALRNPVDPADPIGPRWLEEVMLDLTALGSGGVLVLLVLSVAGYLLLVRKAGLALLVIVAVAGAMILNHFLKLEFERPRPDLVPYLTQATFTSFPSGHSMAAAATYLTLGALLARVQPNRRLKLYFMVLAICLTFLVGLSRVYLGVHWPSDVLGGWTAGATWALFCWLVARWLSRWSG